MGFIIIGFVIIILEVIIIGQIIIVLFGVIWAKQKTPSYLLGACYSYLEVTVLAGRVVIPTLLPLGVAGLADRAIRPRGHQEAASGAGEPLFPRLFVHNRTTARLMAAARIVFTSHSFIPFN